MVVFEVRQVIWPIFSPEYGFLWELESGIGHTGSDPGALSYMYFQPELNAGVVLITNGDGAVDIRNLLELIDQLYESAQVLQ